MEHCSITLSANAGMALQLSGKRILIDAFHNAKVPGFSTMSPELCAEVLEHPAFRAPDMVFFTHCHDDHYSPQWCEILQKRWPEATLVLPQQECIRQLLLCGSEVKFTVDALRFHFIRLTHEGEQYANVPHYGLILDGPDFRILIAADCKVANPQLTSFLGDRPVDLAILEFPWLTLRTGRTFVEEVIRPRRILVNHIPFAHDDTGGFREAAARAAARFSGCDVRLMLEPLQQEHFYL